MADRQSYKEFMRAELKKDQPDMTAITARIKSSQAGRQQSIDEGLDSFNSFYATLDSDQQKQVNKYVRHFVKRMGRHH